MKTFKQYLEEVVNNPYDFREGEKVGDENSIWGHHHRYHFKSDNGRNFTVTISKFREYVNHDVEFKDDEANTPGDFLKKTGKAGKHAGRIFSTVHEIMKRHANNHDVEGYRVSASKDSDGKENSRTRLYDRMFAKRGIKPFEGNDFKAYNIPKDKL